MTLFCQGGFPHEINYEGNNVTNLKYNNTSVWLAPKATGIAYFNTNILPTSGNFRFGFITTCPCRIEIRMRYLSNNQWTTVYNQTWNLTNLSSYVYRSSFSINTASGTVNYEAGPNKFLYDSININSDSEVGAYRILVYDSMDNTLLSDSGDPDNYTTNSCTCTVTPTGYHTQYLNSTTIYTGSATVTSYASETSNLGDSRTVAVTPTASISNSNIITGVSFTHVSGNIYKMTVNFKRNATGSSTVTVKTSWNGKMATATYTIKVMPPVT